MRSKVPYPYNFVEHVFGGEIDRKHYDTKDLEKGIEYCLSGLDDRTREIVKMYYVDGQTMATISRHFNVSSTRIAQIIHRVERNCRKPAHSLYCKYGYTFAKCILHASSKYNHPAKSVTSVPEGVEILEYPKKFVTMTYDHFIPSYDERTKTIIRILGGNYNIGGESSQTIFEVVNLYETREDGNVRRLMVLSPVISKTPSCTWFDTIERWLNGEDIFDCMPASVENKELYFMKFIAMCEDMFENFNHDSVYDRAELVRKLVREEGTGFTCAVFRLGDKYSVHHEHLYEEFKWERKVREEGGDSASVI